MRGTNTEDRGRTGWNALRKIADLLLEIRGELHPDKSGALAPYLARLSHHLGDSYVDCDQIAAMAYVKSIGAMNERIDDDCMAEGSATSVIDVQSLIYSLSLVGEFAGLHWPEWQAYLADAQMWQEE